MTNPKLVLKFDPNTIEHLGVSLYSQLPSVLSELVSNSWDADADNVTINFKDNSSEKEIIFQDDGEGMTYEELNDKYLIIGRNRRNQTHSQETTKGRPVIGKKGLGKLSVFGICDVIEIISIKNGLKNHFIMDLIEIKNSTDKSYFPDVKLINEPATEPSGTILKLTKIRRKSKFNTRSIALSLSKKFLIFDKMKVVLQHNKLEPLVVTNELKYDGLQVQFTWSFPTEQFGQEYEYTDSINGKVITLETPVKDTEMRGIYLTSRGKIVNTASFYGARDNDQFHNYVTGYLEVDFIDDFDEDVISTDRHSLNWENEKTKELQTYLQTVIKRIGSDWKIKRSNLKRDAIKRERDLDVEEWQATLAPFEKELSDKIIDPILLNSNIDTADSTEIIEGVIDKFENQTFKDYASEISNISSKEDIPRLLQLMNEWKTVEAKQFKDLAYSRVEVIKQFEEYINTDTKEVPTLHGFFKKFSWLLDPRILEFKDEVTYSSVLKKSFPEKDLDEKNKRIDFLCSNALGDILYVIEIKRSLYKVDLKALDQAYSYGSFLKRKFSSNSGFSKVVCYVIGGEKSTDYEFSDREETYMNQGQVFVKTYRELLEQSKEYHKEFIATYEEFQKSKFDTKVNNEKQ